MPKWLIVLLIILALIIGLGIAGYGYFFGFTAKQKYEKCANLCEDLMLLESSIPMCKMKCEQDTKYSPENTTKKTDNKTSSPANTNSNSANSKTSVSNDSKYACEWSWPQKIIDANTKKVIKSCTTQQPYCRYDKVLIDDFNAGCCTTAVKDTLGDLTYTNCTNLNDL